MKRQPAIGAFFRPVDKRIRDSETENESDVRSRSSIDSSTSDQASTSRNEEAARNVIALTDQISEESGNNILTLPMPFDVNTLPNELPTGEGRSLRREWFTDFAWLHCNDDGTCHCSNCFWAINHFATVFIRAGWALSTVLILNKLSIIDVIIDYRSMCKNR